MVLVILGVLLAVLTTEVDYMGITIRYANAGKHVLPSAVAGKKPQPTYMTCQAAVSGVPTDVCTAANAISSNNGQLETGHFYALAWYYVYSAEAVFVRFRHADFGGLLPGGMAARTVGQYKCFFDFAKHGRLPVFSAASPLTPVIYAIGTGVPVVILGLYDLGESNPGQPGCEDFNIALATLTNGAALAIFTVLAGDSLYVKDGLGVPVLKAACITGTGPLRGQIRSTDKMMQPNPIELGVVCTLAGDYPAEIQFSEPVLKANSLLSLYGTA